MERGPERPRCPHGPRPRQGLHRAAGGCRGDARLNTGPWYAAGLRFSCRRCGVCCCGSPGYVWLEPGDVAAIAALLGTDPAGFFERHIRRVDDRLCLREEADGRCVLFDSAAGCRAYDARPRQCRTWPFWARNIASPRAWERQAATCPGMGSGALFEREELERLAWSPEAAGRSFTAP